MPFSISHPRYSFVQNVNADAISCYPDQSLCLPLSRPDNLHFQATFQDVVDNPLFAPHYIAYCMAVKAHYDDPFALVYSGLNCRFDTYTSTAVNQFNFNYAAFLAGSVITIYNGTNWDISASFGLDAFTDFDAYNAANVAVLGTNFEPIKIGDCFRLVFVIDELEDDLRRRRRTFLGCTGLFKRTPADECYTSVITYRSNESCFDFDYGDFHTFTNKIELPIYLRDPVMNDDAKVYTRSDGSIIKLYERKEEQYILETDMMPYTWLKALDVALSHDSVSIISPNTSAYDSVNTAQSFMKKEAMEIEYQKGPLTAFGKGTCKLLNANPVHLFNNNCS